MTWTQPVAAGDTLGGFVNNSYNWITNPEAPDAVAILPPGWATQSQDVFGYDDSWGLVAWGNDGRNQFTAPYTYSNGIFTLIEAGVGMGAWTTFVAPQTISTLPSVSISFYTDKALTQFAFTDTSPTSFAISNGAIVYTPSDAVMNTAVGISTTKCQPIYYYQITIADSLHPQLIVQGMFGNLISQGFEEGSGDPTTGVYRNIDNLLYQSAIVSTTLEPTFTLNENQAILVPGPQKLETFDSNYDFNYLIQTYTLVIQLILPEYTNLSEADRYQQGMNITNATRLALYQDRTRGGNATQFSKDVDATTVGQWQPIASDTVLTGRMSIACASMVGATTY